MRKIQVLIGIIGVRVLILLITLLTLTGIYILYRRVFLPRSRSKSIDALIPTLECVGAFDEQVVTANRTTVTYKANRQFAQHFTDAESTEDFEKAKVLLFNTIEDKLMEALDADPRADLSKYESVFGITIVDVAFGGAASKDHEVR